MNRNRWPQAFFASAAFYAMIGVGWGLAMGITKNHATYSAHAHLNLLGWLSQAMMGTFYATVGQGVSNKVKATNFALTNLGVLLMIPGVGMYLGQAAPPAVFGPMITAGSLLVAAGFLLFGVTVILNLFKGSASTAAA
ncbi:hypothetical protein [Caulobacter sp.]|uniref:hypothetical protein n=1 Tax=Caulobacter sp. TaxID=78 RepID=UPI002B49E267|nr:hypothetical protein [Caulobacter sp.]HJV41540.1 hypothetical protein [Caulobacter sp.]